MLGKIQSRCWGEVALRLVYGLMGRVPCWRDPPLGFDCVGGSRPLSLVNNGLESTSAVGLALMEVGIGSWCVSGGRFVFNVDGLMQTQLVLFVLSGSHGSPVQLENKRGKKIEISGAWW